MRPAKESSTPVQTTALLAWLVPGLGHLYQGRIAKGVLFLVCLWGSFLYGLYLGGGQVVYLKWDQEGIRLPYFAQIGAGVVALPGLVQWLRAQRNAGPMPLLGRFQAPPDKGELDELYFKLGRWQELGTVYTMLAGLLNILVIYDAVSGPAHPEENEESQG